MKVSPEPEGSLPHASLAPYVPRVVLEWQVSDPGARVLEVEGSLVMVDLSGFTAMSERLSRLGKHGAEEVTDVVGTTFAQLLRVAYDAGGSLLKFGGDALLLFFTGDANPQLACRAATGMRAELRRTGPISTSAGAVRLRMSVGVHSGTFHLFLAGRSHRELVVTGPGATATVAAEADASAGEILLSAGTWSRLDDRLLGAARGSARLLRRAPAAGATSAAPVDLRPPVDPAPFVPAAVREHVAGGGSEPEHRQVTVAFIRFLGTDAVLEREGPAALAVRLDEVVGITQDAMDDLGLCFVGTDVYPDGGKLICMAGAPRASENDEERMLLAMRRIVDAVTGVDLRIGVHSGRAFTGDVGPFYRRTYTVMGDTVNTAARVMSKAGPAQILATHEVVRRSRTGFEMRPVEPFAVKGKARPLECVAVGSPVRSRAVAPSQLPLVGRDAEVRALLGHADESAAGSGRLVEVVGGPGMGKSRLLDEIARRRPAIRAIRISCDEYGAERPYDALRGTLDDLERALAAATAGIGDPRSGRARVHREVSRAIGPGPLLWLIDDAQWMDEASADLLRYLIDLSSDRPWLFCVARRAGGGAWADAEPQATVTLAPLPPDDAIALVRASAAVPLLPARARALAEHGAGNPLFLQELAAVGEDGSPDDLPSTVESLVASRIDALLPSDRTVLRHLSVLGQTFDGSSVLAVAGTEPAWERLSEFVDASAAGGRFRAALFRQVAYEGLPYRRRRALHAVAGAHIEGTAADVDAVAGLLSLHFHHAQDHERSWRYGRTAAVRARAQFAQHEAAAFWRRALDAAAHLDVPPGETTAGWQTLADCLRESGDLRGAEEALSKARALSGSDPVALSRLCWREGVVREEQGRLPQAQRWYRRGLRTLDGTAGERESGEIRLMLRLASAGTRYRQGRFRECVREAGRVADEADAAGFPWLAGDACSRIHLAMIADRAPGRARWGERAVELFERAARTGEVMPEVCESSIGEVLNNLGMDAYYGGLWDEALSLYGRSRETLERCGHVLPAAVVASNIGEILSDRGRLDEARRLFTDAFETLRAGRSPFVHLIAANLGRVAAREGRSEEALRWLTDARRGFLGIGAAAQAAEQDVRIADCLVQQGRAAEALAAAEAASLELGESAHRVRGFALAQLGRPDEAHAAFLDALRAAEQTGAPHERAWTLQALARISRDEAYADEASAILDRLGIVASPWTPL